MIFPDMYIVSRGKIRILLIFTSSLRQKHTDAFTVTALHGKNTGDGTRTTISVAIYYSKDDVPYGYMVYMISSDVMHVKEMIYLNREAQLGLWEFIHAHDSMIDEVRGNNYYSEPIAFELDDSDIKETIRPYTMGRIIDIRQFFAKYACDPDEPSVCIRFYIEDDLLAWNNGYFTYLFDNGRCIETEQQPDYEVSMSIGTLTTLMLGYKTAEKLHVMDKIQASDEAVEHLDDILFHRIPYVSKDSPLPFFYTGVRLSLTSLTESMQVVEKRTFLRKQEM